MKYYIKAFQNYATFTGRTSRREYWYFFLFNFIFSSLIGIIGAKSGMPILSSLYLLVIFLPAMALGVRRMHDVGKNGWFLLIPIYNLILALTEGTKGTNAYGADPYAST